MASTEAAIQTEKATLQELARRHLWMHFTRMSAYDDHEIPIIVRGSLNFRATRSSLMSSSGII